MAVIPVPGFQGNWVVNTINGQAWRVGSAGGTHDVADYRTFGPEFASAAEGEMNAFRQATTPPGPSPEEQRMLELSIQQAEQQMAYFMEQKRREDARRKAYARYIAGERWDPTNQEQQEGQQAARSAELAEKEQGQLMMAYEGKLPVSPATARAIRENQDVLNERLRRNLGEGGWEAGTPGGEALGRFEESSAILKDVERQGLIQRGITPAMNAAQLARESIGSYAPPNVTGLNQLLGTFAASRGAQQAGAASAYNAGSQYYSDIARLRAAAEAQGGGLGKGLGGALGGIAGAVIGSLITPGIGTAVGGALGGIGGSALGGGLSGGSYNPFSGGGTGFGNLSQYGGSGFGGSAPRWGYGVGPGYGMPRFS